MERQVPFEGAKKAAEKFRQYVKDIVVDLGAGDGMANVGFEGLRVIAVDINSQKLRENEALCVQMDFVSFLNLQSDGSLPSIFCHHSLEHFSRPKKVLNLIAKKLAKGNYVYIEVPHNDGIHSVHHSSFTKISDITPRGLEVIDSGLGSNIWLIARQN